MKSIGRKEWLSALFYRVGLLLDRLPITIHLCKDFKAGISKLIIFSLRPIRRFHYSGFD
jgi:hypothetical protein